MPKRYLWIIAIYIFTQLSGIIGIPILLLFSELSRKQTIGLWTTVSFLAALVIVLLLLKKDIAYSRYKNQRTTLFESVIWTVGGIFLAIFAQAAAGFIEQQLFGVTPHSENTRMISRLAKEMPYFILIPVLVGPILEEIVFRKIIFGVFYQKTNFWAAALISSLIFSLAHLEPEHLLVYMAMGLTFCYLYAKTGRILVPIATHVAMNAFVLLIQIVLADEIQRYLEKSEKLSQFIGGFWL